MPDISMCANNHDCEYRLKCWRAMAPHSPRWQAFSPFFVEGEECEYRWPVYEHAGELVGATKKA